MTDIPLPRSTLWEVEGLVQWEGHLLAPSTGGESRLNHRPESLSYQEENVDPCCTFDACAS